MNVNGKYLKDENGNIISPVTSADSVFIDNTKLSTKLTLKQLFSGDVCGLDSLTMSDSYNNYTFLIINGWWNNESRYGDIIIMQPKISLYGTLVTRFSPKNGDIEYKYDANLQLYDNNKLKIVGGYGHTINASGNTAGIFCGNNQIHIKTIYGIL